MDYMECRDSTGIVSIKKGFGKLIVYTDDFKAAIKKINIKDGVVDGNWLPIIDSAATMRFDQTGPIETSAAVMPTFDSEKSVMSYFLRKKSTLYFGWPKNFVRFAVRNFNYPKQSLKSKTSETVHLTMVVEKNGALTHIKATHASSKLLEDEIIRVTGLSSQWRPGTLADGTPVRVLMTLNFKFIFEPNKKATDPEIAVYFGNNDNGVALTDSIYNKTDSAFLAGTVDKQPEYPGGLEGIKQTMNDYLHYPQEDREKQRKGKVYIQFIIEKDGHVSNVHAISGPSETMKAEAERVVKLFAPWQPGLKDNKPARVIYTMPIGFSLALE